MKLYYISGSTIPSNRANSVHVMKMCQALARLDEWDDVTLFGRKGKNHVDISQSYGVEEIFDLELISTLPVPVIGGMQRIYKTWSQIRKRGFPDVFYGRDIYGLSMLSRAGMPIFIECHQVPTGTQKQELIRIFQSVNFAGCVVISKVLQEDLLEFFPDYLDRTKIVVAHDGADLPDDSYIESKIKLKGRKNAMKIGYAGSFHSGKGAEIIPDIARKLPDYDFHLLGGDADQLASFKSTAPNNCYFYGHLPHKQTQNLIARTDIVLAPYQKKIHIASGADISRWISPLKLFEYMALGKPIVVSDIPVLHEVLTDQENALFVEPDNIDEWVGAITKLSDGKGLRQRFGQKGKELIAQKYSWVSRAEKITDFILSSMPVHAQGS